MPCCVCAVAEPFPDYLEYMKDVSQRDEGVYKELREDLDEELSRHEIHFEEDEEPLWPCEGKLEGHAKGRKPISLETFKQKLSEKREELKCKVSANSELLVEELLGARLPRGQGGEGSGDAGARAEGEG